VTDSGREIWKFERTHEEEQREEGHQELKKELPGESKGNGMTNE